MQGEDVVIGSAFVLTAAIAFALYQLLAKDVIAKVGPRLFTCIAMLGASAAAFTQFIAVEELTAIFVSPKLFLYGIFLAYPVYTHTH